MCRAAWTGTVFANATEDTETKGVPCTRLLIARAVLPPDERAVYVWLRLR